MCRIAGVQTGYCMEFFKPQTVSAPSMHSPLSPEVRVRAGLERAGTPEPSAHRRLSCIPAATGVPQA